MNGPDSESVAPPIVELIDDYCADLIDEAGLRRLEAELIASAATRRYFVEYLQLHAELGFSSRARRAANQALARFEQSATSVPGRGRLRVSRRMMAAAAVLIAGTGFALGHWGWNRRAAPLAAQTGSRLAQQRPGLPLGGRCAWSGHGGRQGVTARPRSGRDRVRARRPGDPQRPIDPGVDLRQRGQADQGVDDSAGAGPRPRVHGPDPARPGRRPRHRVRPGDRRPVGRPRSTSSKAS